MNNLVKHIKKFHPKQGDILLVTLKGTPPYYEVERIKNLFASMTFLKGTYLLFVNENVQVTKGKPEKGKHRVYLNNLEYLEYLAAKNHLEKDI